MKFGSFLLAREEERDGVKITVIQKLQTVKAVVHSRSCIESSEFRVTLVYPSDDVDAKLRNLPVIVGNEPEPVELRNCVRKTIQGSRGYEYDVGLRFRILSSRLGKRVFVLRIKRVQQGEVLESCSSNPLFIVSKYVHSERMLHSEPPQKKQRADIVASQVAEIHKLLTETKSCRFRFTDVAVNVMRHFCTMTFPQQQLHVQKICEQINHNHLRALKTLTHMIEVEMKDDMGDLLWLTDKL